MNAITTLPVLSHHSINDQHDHEAMLLKAMSHPDRYRVLKILASEGEVQAGELGKWSDLSQSAMSQHLKVLRDAGLVDVRRDSQRMYYTFRKSQGATLPQSISDLFG